MDQAGVDRVLVIARELESVGRHNDAQLLARLAAEAGAEFEPALTAQELDDRLTDAESEIAAGRLTPNERVWGEIDQRRRDPARTRSA